MEYPVVVDSFVTWCEQNHLQLHVTETKELIGDFKRTRKPAAIYTKCQRCLYFLRQLRWFNICRTTLRIVESVVASAIFYAVACWGRRLRVMDAKRLNKMMCKASKMVRLELPKGSVGEEVQDEENTGQYLSPTPWQVTDQYNGILRLPKYTTNYTGNWLARCTIPPSKSQVHTLNIKSIW